LKLTNTTNESNEIEVEELNPKESESSNGIPQNKQRDSTVERDPGKIRIESYHSPVNKKSSISYSTNSQPRDQKNIFKFLAYKQAKNGSPYLKVTEYKQNFHY